MMIDTLEAVPLGGMTQWIRIRGEDAANPVLLLMQLGPGLPIINDARRFERLLGLERDFTVVYWDQRGTGLTLRNANAEISADRGVSDTVSLLELLRDRFGGKSFVAGFSFGATFAAQAAAQRPDLVAAVIATGMDIDIPLAEEKMYDFLLNTARQRRNRRAIRQLEKIGPPPHLATKQFATRARWAFNFGGIRTIRTTAARSARCSAACSARPTTRSGTSSAQSVASPRPRPRSCPNSPPRTWFAPCRASTFPSSSCRAGSTGSRRAKPHSGTTTP